LIRTKISIGSKNRVGLGSMSRWVVGLD